jgi:hypothetical protein
VEYMGLIYIVFVYAILAYIGYQIYRFIIRFTSTVLNQLARIADSLQNIEDKLNSSIPSDSSAPSDEIVE